MSEFDSDFEYSKKTYYDLINKGNDALEEMIEVARALEHPRAFEVVSGMIKNISDVNDRLMDLHNKKKKLIEPTKGEEPKQVTNNTAVFMGSTTDLQKMIQDMSNDIEGEIVIDDK